MNGRFLKDSFRIIIGLMCVVVGLIMVAVR